MVPHRLLDMPAPLCVARQELFKALGQRCHDFANQRDQPRAVTAGPPSGGTKKMTTELPPAGWYPDPNGGPGQMYWDGQRWDTETPATPPPNQSGIPSPSGDQRPRRGPTPALIALIVAIVAVVVMAVVVISVVLNNHHTGPASQPSGTSQPVTTTQITQTTAPPTANQTSVHYIKTETTSTGFSDTNDWYFTSCGDGCAEVATSPGGQPFGRAQLVNGQWTMDNAADSVCSDGTKVPNADSDHFTWDPNTLMGTDRVTNNLPTCGNPAGYQYTNSLQLRKTP